MIVIVILLSAMPPSVCLLSILCNFCDVNDYCDGAGCLYGFSVRVFSTLVLYVGGCGGDDVNCI